MVLEPVVGVLPLPAASTEVLEAREVAAEVRSNHALADGAQGVLKIRINLNLWRGEGTGEEGK